jgi:hypothetical protein
LDIKPLINDKYANGLIMQWGFLTTDGSTATVYPLAINFSNTYYGINATVLSAQK